MTDALLSLPVGLAMCGISAAAISYSIKKEDLIDKKKIPMMGAMGAFIFAAQMINFAIPGTGSSGHLVGGILLAAMLGAYPALLTMSAVLTIQCLFFADGSLLALGANIFNMAVIPCLVIYPLIFEPLVKKGATPGRITIAATFASLIALQIGALGVVLQTLASGITELPFLAFAAAMQPIHLAAGLVEGIATAAILCLARKVPAKPVIATAVIALLIGGVFSQFVSSNPDGLEWSIEKVAGIEFEISGEPIATAFMPDYNFKNSEGSLGTSIAGITGGMLTFLLVAVIAFAISAFPWRQNSKLTS
jgi:cobalt/nickel transport system permease protein